MNRRQLLTGSAIGVAGAALPSVMARSTVLKEAVAAGKLSIRSAYFDIGSGKVTPL